MKATDLGDKIYMMARQKSTRVSPTPNLNQGLYVRQQSQPCLT